MSNPFHNLNNFQSKKIIKISTFDKSIPKSFHNAVVSLQHVPLIQFRGPRSKERINHLEPISFNDILQESENFDNHLSDSINFWELEDDAFYGHLIINEREEMSILSGGASEYD